MQAEHRVSVGPVPTGGDGAPVMPALGRFTHSLTADLLPKFYEAVSRGYVFSGGTAVTGVAPGTAIGTASPFTLANPSGSGKVLVPIRTTCAYISGTLGAGSAHYVANVNPAAAAVSGTAITVVKNRLSTSTPGNVGLLFTTATLPATPTVLRPAWSWAPLLATTALAPYLIKDDLDGEIVVAPGCALSIESTATGGSTPLVAFGMTWVELPE